MSSEKLQRSLESGVHKELQKLVGEWEGPTKTWFEPDKLADTSPMRGTIKPVLGGMFVTHEYKGALKGKPFEGIAIYGYDLGSEKYQSAWIDSFHMGTGIMFSESPKSDKFSVLGSYGGPNIPEPWGWRTEIEVINPDKIVITAYNITPTGEEAKATETVYTRVK